MAVLDKPGAGRRGYGRLVDDGADPSGPNNESATAPGRADADPRRPCRGCSEHGERLRFCLPRRASHCQAVRRSSDPVVGYGAVSTVGK